jgi:hypothetical protein
MLLLKKSKSLLRRLTLHQLPVRLITMKNPKFLVIQM